MCHGALITKFACEHECIFGEEIKNPRKDYDGTAIQVKVKTARILRLHTEIRADGSVKQMSRDPWYWESERHEPQLWEAETSGWYTPISTETERTQFIIHSSF